MLRAVQTQHTLHAQPRQPASSTSRPQRMDKITLTLSTATVPAAGGVGLEGLQVGYMFPQPEGLEEDSTSSIANFLVGNI